MPIDFRCSACSKLIRVPDSAAGKQARCPSCGSVVDIPGKDEHPYWSPPVSSTDPPGSSPERPPGMPDGPPTDTSRGRSKSPATGPATPPGSPPPGMPSASPFAQPVGGGPGGRPYATPSYRPADNNPFSSPVDVTVNPEYQVDGSRYGPAWERLGPSVNSFIETVKEIYSSPSDMFSNMRRLGGLGAPLGFAVVGAWIGMVFYFLYALAQNLIFGAVLLDPVNRQVGGAMAIPVITLISILLASLIFVPLFVAIGLFINSAIMHVCLMIVRGANRPYETTFRVLCYAYGASVLLMAIPCVGVFAVGICNLIFSIFGYSSAHEISSGKATAAALMPLMVCCGCGAIAWFGFAFIVLLFAPHH